MTAIRRALSRPSASVLLAVAGVFIVDAPPPAPVNAAPFGKIVVVGEFEDGPFNEPTDLLSSADQRTIFGGFGFQYGSTKYNYPCAKRSGGTEYWNGNAWIQTAYKRFGKLAFCRVDTSIGTVTFTPRAYVQGTNKAPFVMTAGQTFIFNANGAGNVTATFAAAAAVTTASGGTYTGLVGGETISVSLDHGTATEIQFQPGDNTLTAIINRINLVLGATVASNSSGNLRLTSTKLGTASQIVVTNNATSVVLGLTSGSDVTANGSGDAADIAAVTQAEFKTKIEAASALVAVTQSSTGYPRVVSKLGGSGTMLIGSGTGNTALGFVAATSATAALPSAQTIPAGTRLSDGGASSTRVVTMVTTSVASGSTAATNIKVRPAVDDGTYAGLSGGSIDTLEDAPSDLEWSVTNGSALGDALTASELDSLYVAAIRATKGVGNDITRKTNGILSARQSAAIRAELKTNAVDTSASGHYDRRAFLCPANGTSAAAAIVDKASYAVEEVSYCVGGISSSFQELIDGGHNDGVAATVDGEITLHPDTFLASRWSSLTPGYNPGQIPEDPVLRFDSSRFFGLESAASAWDNDTYAAFKEAGICAAEFDPDTGISFEQGVTAVDPASEPSRVDISRRTLAGFIGDSIAQFLKPQAKRQGTSKRRDNIQDSIESFLEQLVGDTVETSVVSQVESGLNHVAEFSIAVEPIQSDDVFLLSLSVGAGAVTVSR